MLVSYRTQGQKTMKPQSNKATKPQSHKAAKPQNHKTTKQQTIRMIMKLFETQISENDANWYFLENTCADIGV